MRKPKILIVDGDEKAAEGTRRMLESRDYVVSSSGDPDAGLSRIRSEKPDLIILDSAMAGEGDSARHLPEEIREEPGIAYIPILMANSSRGPLRPGVKVDARILKPARPDALFRQVARLLGMRSSRWAARFSE